MSSGGAIGPPGTRWDYPGRFDGTPVFLGCSDVDSHVPELRVSETAELFSHMGADVTKRIYPGMGHVVNDDEIAYAERLIDLSCQADRCWASCRTRASRPTGREHGLSSTFGAVAELAAELDSLQILRPLIVTTPGRAPMLGTVRDRSWRRVVGVCDLAALHVPIDRVRAAVMVIDRTGPDALLAIGGGSAIGLAKAMALERGLPIAVVPTTYAGSEMTSIWGVTGGDAKRTGRDPSVAPRLVVYDPNVTLSLPAHVSAASGMNAVAHAVEALYAPEVGPSPRPRPKRRCGHSLAPCGRRRTAR